MSGKHLYEWKRRIIKDIAIARYTNNQELLKLYHEDLANMYFNEFCEEHEEEVEEPVEEEEEGAASTAESEPKETPFKSTLHSDVTYTLRHVEESWIHLLKAGDIVKFKTLTMLNYDFLLAAVCINYNCVLTLIAL